MVGKKRLASLLAVSTGFVAAILLIQINPKSSTDSLYEVVQLPNSEVRNFAFAPRIQAGFFRNPSFVYAFPRSMPIMADEEGSLETEDPPSEIPEDIGAEESDKSAFPPEDEPQADDQPQASEASPEPPVEAEAEKPEPEEPDNLLGDEVIDLPKDSDSSDLGDMYVSGKDAEKNSYTFKQHGARQSILYNAPDPFNIAPATYDSYSGDTHGLFKAQIAQALLARSGAGEERGRAVVRSGAPKQSLWLGENWYIDGLQDDGQYMVPADPQQGEGYGNSLFDFGKDGGVAFNPETRMPAPGMTTFYKGADGETPGLFDVDAIRANEDGDLPKTWYQMNEPAANFMRGGKGKWAPGRSPSVMVMNGHVVFIDDGIPPSLRT